jgi:predicted Rossmann fold flavoprotein
MNEERRTKNAFDVAVIGAGAAGLMAAIAAGRAGARVVLLDGAKRIGAKILISGGGRCNVTHGTVRPEDFNGSSRAIAKVLRTFTVEETIAFFRDLGVALKREETGKLFPVTDRAQTVLDALLRAASEAGVSLERRRVAAIAQRGGAFELAAGEETITARRAIIATGGESVPSTGSDGAGYGIVRALGHGLTPRFPALVPLLLPKGHWLTLLSGLSIDAELTVASATGRVIQRTRGSVLFTHFGLSGPGILDVSRHWIAARREDAGVALVMNALPGADRRALEDAIVASAKEHPRMAIETYLALKFPDRFARAVVEHGAPATPSTALGRLDRDTRRRIAAAVVELALPVTGDRGWNYAEVTAGGVPLAELHLATMESRIVPGLYLCGEILDVDGRIGGFNFQWAWASGRLAGMAAAR